MRKPRQVSNVKKFKQLERLLQDAHEHQKHIIVELKTAGEHPRNTPSEQAALAAMLQDSTAIQGQIFNVLNKMYDAFC